MCSLPAECWQKANKIKKHLNFCKFGNVQTSEFRFATYSHAYSWYLHSFSLSKTETLWNDYLPCHPKIQEVLKLCKVTKTQIFVKLLTIIIWKPKRVKKLNSCKLLKMFTHQGEMLIGLKKSHFPSKFWLDRHYPLDWKVWTTNFSFFLKDRWNLFFSNYHEQIMYSWF